MPPPPTLVRSNPNPKDTDMERPHITTRSAFAAYMAIYNARRESGEDYLAPTYQELGAALGVSHEAGREWINRLIEKGKLRKHELYRVRGTVPVGET